MIVHRGKVVFDYGNVEELSYIASCRKSILAMLYGPFVENGTIDLTTTLEDLDMDDIRGLLPIEKKATINNILTSRSGVYHPASNPGDQSNLAPERGTVVPGTSWLYNNWDFNIAGYILEKQTNENIYDLVDSMFAKPMQMQHWRRDAQHKSGDAGRSKYPAYHMWFSTEDMARLGYLMLREGNWNGEQIISRSWIEKITTPVTTYREAFANQRNYSYFGFGYMWWCWDNPDNSGIYAGWYSAMGAYGQFITVFPKLDLVVVHKNNSMQTETSIETYLKVLLKIISAREQ
jgi:CubicO group peptidase (beta-lactamase class C family)